jgi:Domain of unknown function (DUF2715)
MFRSPLRSLILTASAAATLLCVAPAFAQESPPPGTNVPPPMQAMTAAKGSEDMTGSLGFGLGVTAGTQTLITPTTSIALKYWLNDTLVVVPAFNFNVNKPAPAGSTTTWTFNPEAVILFVPFRSTSTRLEVGGGFGFSIGKPVGAVNTDVQIYVPIQAGVEHFFTRWFSLGIAARANLIDYHKDVGFSSTITTTSNTNAVIPAASAVGQLFFYTD